MSNPTNESVKIWDVKYTRPPEEMNLAVLKLEDKLLLPPLTTNRTVALFLLRAISTDRLTSFSGHLIALTNSSRGHSVSLEYRYAIHPMPLKIPDLERSFYIGNQLESLENDVKDKIARKTVGNTEILEIQKEISITNNFLVDLNFDQIETTTQSLKWTNFRIDKTFSQRKKEKLLQLTFRCPLRELPLPFSSEFLILESGHLFFPLKLTFYDNTLLCAMTKNDQSYEGGCNASEILDFNFGNVAIGEVSKSFIIIAIGFPTLVYFVSSWNQLRSQTV